MLASAPQPAYPALHRLRFALLFFCLLSTAPLPAQPLFQSQIPMVDQDEVARVGAIKAGLAEVLVRLSGDSAITRHYAIGLILQQSEQYLASYEYKVVPEEISEAKLQLLLNFDPERVKAALQTYQIPLWPESRPTTLLWLALQDSDGRRLINSDDAAGTTLKQAATQRGLPLLLPLLDLEDRVGVALSDIWLDNPDPVKLASERYQANALIIARAEQTPTGWLGHWTLYFDNSAERWKNQAGSITLLLGEGISGATDRLAKHYLSDPATGGSGYILTLTGISDFADYARAFRYLEQLEPVVSAQPRRLSGAEALFALELRGDTASLARRIELDSVLLPVGNPATWATGTLAFRLLPKRAPL